jgi:ABC-type nickel/cobalt efflux system permease component RcnA
METISESDTNVINTIDEKKIAEKTSTEKKLDAIRQMLKVENIGKEKEFLRKQLGLSKFQLICALGLAITGVASIITLYQAIFDINKVSMDCSSQDDVQKEINIKFWVLLILGILLITFAFIMMIVLRKSDRQYGLVTVAILIGGILAIVYGLSIKFQKVSNWTKFSINIVSFAIFIGLGIYATFKSDKEKQLQLSKVESKAEIKS